jgi:hypothetical protein
VGTRPKFDYELSRKDRKDVTVFKYFDYKLRHIKTAHLRGFYINTGNFYK